VGLLFLSWGGWPPRCRHHLQHTAQAHHGALQLTYGLGPYYCWLEVVCQHQWLAAGPVLRGPAEAKQQATSRMQVQAVIDEHLDVFTCIGSRG
jgi:hypothetical protein